MALFGRSVLVALVWILYISSSSAAVVQDDWVQPAKPDNTTTLTIGETFNIQWTSNLWQWFGGYAPGADVTNVDLYICGFYQHQYEVLVSTRVNVNASTSTLWVVQIPASYISATPWWVFRFVAAGTTPSESAGQVSSPGVFVQNAIASTSSASDSTVSTAGPTSSVSASILSTATTAQSSLASTPTSTSTLPSDPSASNNVSSGLSTGAKVGIACGAVFGAVILVAAGWYLATKKNRRSPPPIAERSTEKELAPAYDPQSGPKYNYTPHPKISELQAEPGTHLRPLNELPGHR